MIKKNQYFPQSRAHPGITLSEKLEEMGMETKELAERIDETEETITQIINGKIAITHNMAIQFEQVTQIPVHFWINSELNYDKYIKK